VSTDKERALAMLTEAMRLVDPHAQGDQSNIELLAETLRLDAEVTHRLMGHITPILLARHDERGPFALLDAFALGVTMGAASGNVAQQEALNIRVPEGVDL
jgi:hypothetical protein